MNITPMDIRRRPFSVEFYTNVMLPDGIFDSALKKQWITCFYTNTSSASLHEVTIYLEGVGDPGIVPMAHSYFFQEIKPGASVRIGWLADFEHGTPGKKLVSFIAKAKGMSLVRTLKHIFVSKTTRDVANRDYTCTVEEGTLRISKLEVIGPRDKWQPCSERYKNCRPAKGPWVPAKMSMTFFPNPSYAGIHGDLPFSDPWWKILAWIVFAVASLVAIIEAAKGAGTAMTAISGTFDQWTGDIDCCTPDPQGVWEVDDSVTIAGVASAIATAAMAVGMSDDKDPWWRGQKATPPVSGEQTVAEKVDIVFRYPAGAPNAGVPYTVNVKWEYQRITTGNTYTHSVEEIRKNIHVNGGVEVELPSVHHAFTEPLIIKARFKREDGKQLFIGEDIYAFSLLRSPDNMYFLVNLTDDGIEPDKEPNDGTYSGLVNLENVYRILLKYNLKLDGLWRVYVFAQDVNNATPDMPPQIAAQRIGGFIIASGLQITFDPTLPCPLNAQAAFTIVT
jgi:hypothetical protein